MRSRRLRVIFGDVVHKSYGALSPATVPFGVARIAAVAMGRYPGELDVALVKDVDGLLEALRAGPPDVVALSHYFWNTRLSSALVRYVKETWPECIVVQGGPNLNHAEDAYRAHAAANPRLDFHVIGDGEVPMADLLGRRLAAAAAEIEAIKRAAVPGMFAVVDGGRDVVVGRELDRAPLADMPSPYLLGLLDPFLDRGLEPIVEFTRGCPYACAFCEQGSEYFRKLYWLDLERAKEEVEYIKPRVKTDTLIIADVNFGILPRDIELSRYLKQSHAQGGFPKQVYVYTAKNPNRRTLEVIETLWPLTPFYASFQSTDAEVLDNIHRSNIGYDKYLAVTTWAKAQGIPIGTELIFGLPGETLTSFVAGIAKLMRLNSDYLAMYNLRLFPGIELNAPEVRDRYGMKTMFRPMDTNFGEYDLGGPVRILECEEIITGSKAFSFEDFLTARAVGFLTELLWNSGYLRPLLAYLQSHGVAPVDLFMEILARVKEAPAAVERFFADYLEDVHRELFPTEEALEREITGDQWWSYIQGGGRFLKINLAYVGKALLFGVEGLDEWIDREIVGPRLAALDLPPGELSAVEDLRRYMRLLRIGMEPAADPPPTRFAVDILGWIRGAYDGELVARRPLEGVVYRFKNPDPDAHARFRQKYNARNGGWSQKHVGERFMMELHVARVLRTVEYEGAPPSLPAVVVKRDWAESRQSHDVKEPLKKSLPIASA